jgi:hypothetical protein
MTPRRIRSRKQSDASSIDARRLSEAVFYLGESIFSHVLLDAMTTAGATVRRVGPDIPPGAPDEVWLTAAGAPGLSHFRVLARLSARPRYRLPPSDCGSRSRRSIDVRSRRGGGESLTAGTPVHRPEQPSRNPPARNVAKRSRTCPKVACGAGFGGGRACATQGCQGVACIGLVSRALFSAFWSRR